jgi:hypothetical protein
MVAATGIEPARARATDFKSVVSTYFTTRPLSIIKMVPQSGIEPTSREYKTRHHPLNALGANFIFRILSAPEAQEDAHNSEQ